MRILIVSQYFWPETFRINDVAHGLRDPGHEVAVSYTGKSNYSPAAALFPSREVLAQGNAWTVPNICARLARAVT